MSEAQHLADTLIAMFAWSNHGILAPFTTAVSGLTARRAAAEPGYGLHSMWALVNHVRFWHEVTLLQLRCLPVDLAALGAEDGWPPPDDPPTEEAWQAAVANTIALNEQVTGLIETLTDESLAEPVVAGQVTRRQVVQSLIAHNCYHTGSIIDARRVLGLWPGHA
ncbi:MAG: DinB family protein [Anaerolineae bacterium]|nr:DinB family protein [Anaerolineae bacterium]